MTQLKIFTITDIRSWKPCYDPAKHLPEGWNGTALDILRRDDIPPQDRLWVVLREELLDAKTLRLFAVWCARQVEHLMSDPRSIDAINVVEQFALGTASDDQLENAGAAAWAAEVAEAADRAAARAGAAMAAARDAAWAAAGAAAWAARAAARDAARAAQIKRLIEMLEGNNGNV